MDKKTLFDENQVSTTTDKPTLNARKLSFRQVPTIFHKCFELPEYLKPYDKNVFHREVSKKIGTTVNIKNKKLLSFWYCDYLGLSENKKIKSIIKKHIDKYSTGISSSRIIAGTTSSHRKLEKKLAEFIGGEDCIVYILGYMANIGTIQTIVKSNETVIVDAQSHASIIDGCNLAKINGAKIIPYKHNNMSDLNIKLNKYATNGTLIVTDGVFSMDGDIAKLNEIHRLAKKYNAGVMVDDAHGLGMLGQFGSGTVEHFNLQNKIDLTMGTLSKSVPLLGGYIVGKKEIIEYLKGTSRSYLFCLSLPPYIVEAAIESIEIIKNGIQLRKQLWENTKYLKSNLLNLKFELTNSETPIISILTRDYNKTFKLAKILENMGFFIDAIIYPAVKKNSSRLRIILTANHSKNDIDQLLFALQKTAKSLNLI